MPSRNTKKYFLECPAQNSYPLILTVLQGSRDGSYGRFSSFHRDRFGDVEPRTESLPKWRRDQSARYQCARRISPRPRKASNKSTLKNPLCHRGAGTIDKRVGFGEFACVSAREIIAQIDALPPQEREVVFEHVHRLEEANVPENFRRSMAEALAGKGVDMETALREVPPSRR